MAIYDINGQRPTFPEDRSMWIAPSADVIGDVRIGCDVSIWFGAAIRGDNAKIDIRQRSNVQECAVLHADPGFPLTVGEGCTIGHGAILHGCTLGDNVLVGIGAKVLNGAHISADSIVGAGALVTEGKAFAERSLIVGAPAKAIRSLSDEEVAFLRFVADDYVHKKSIFSEQLTVIG